MPGTPNVTEQGQFAVDSYKQPGDCGQNIPGWSPLKAGDKDTGLKIQSYINPDSSHIHIAIGGTDPNDGLSELWKDVKTDVAFTNGDFDPQFVQALEYVAETIDAAYKYAKPYTQQ